MIPWSYSDDITILENTHLTAKEIYELLSKNHSIQMANRRRIQLKNTSVGDLILEEIYITNNYETMSEKEIAKELNTTLHYVQLRVMSLVSEGKVKDIRPQKKVEIYEPKEFKVEPMKKEMVVEYDAAPKGSLSKEIIQEDFLEAGQYYKITTKHKSDRNSTKLKSEKLKVIGCYSNHYLFINEKGIKHSFTKLNYYLKEWQYELCI